MKLSKLIQIDKREWISVKLILTIDDILLLGNLIIKSQSIFYFHAVAKFGSYSTYFAWNPFSSKCWKHKIKIPIKIVQMKIKSHCFNIILIWIFSWKWVYLFHHCIKSSEILILLRSKMWIDGKLMHRPISIWNRVIFIQSFAAQKWEHLLLSQSRVWW